MGELLDELEGAGAAGRRQIVDRAREAVVLRTITEIKKNQAFAETTSLATARTRTGTATTSTWRSMTTRAKSTAGTE